MESPASFITQFESKLENFLNCFPNESTLVESAKYICLSKKAKRVRPHFVYIFANYFQADEEFALDVAFVAELVHTASLLHDDILDQAEKRRGKPTVHTIHSVPMAVLTGDWLYAKSLNFMEEYNKEAYKSIVDVSAEMSFAVALEYQLRNSKNWNLSKWLEIAKGKTGNLLAWAGEIIFLYKNPNIDAKKFFYACLLFGIAFQILDDVKDFISNKEGKTIYKDLINGNINFVLVQALKENSNFSPELENFFQLAEEERKKNVDSIVSSVFSNVVVGNVIRIVQQALTLSHQLFGEYSCPQIYLYLEKWLSLFFYQIDKNPKINKNVIEKLLDSFRIQEYKVTKDNIFWTTDLMEKSKYDSIR